MKKYYYLLGIITIAVILLGGLSVPGANMEDPEPESGPFDDGPMPGTYNIFFDMRLNNVWETGPTVQGSLPAGRINTNYHYMVTEMVSPLDQFFNAGFFGLGEGGPLFSINGTFVGSELFIKVINDQGGLIDWQPLLILGEDIVVEYQLGEPTLAGAGSQDEGPAFPVELLPDNITLPAGSATPPFPVIRSTTNFSDYFEWYDLLKDMGYYGLPFFTPGIFFLESISDAYQFWAYETNVTKMLFGEDDENAMYLSFMNNTYYDGSTFSLELSWQWSFPDDPHNQSMKFEWGADGTLDSAYIEFFSDMNNNSLLEPEEEISIKLEYQSEEQTPIPLSLNDAGKYELYIDLDISVDIENETEETMINDLLTYIVSSIEELNGYALLNYTVDSMDGLYYHVDGYMLNLEWFIKDRLGFLFGAGPPPTDPGLLPPVQDYYFPLGDSMSQYGYRDFAINLFDAYRYENTTVFYETYDGYYWEYWDEYGYHEVFEPLHCNDTKSMQFDSMFPGIQHAYVFEAGDWESNWDDNTPFNENLQNALDGSLDVYSGPVDYMEIGATYWNGTDWVPDDWTYTELWIQSPIDVFIDGVDYIAVFEISEFAGLDFTSYLSKQNPLMGLFGNNGGEEDYMAGIGTQDVYQVTPNLFGIAIPNYGEFIPMPIRTPDWDAIGGLYTLLESYVDQVSSVITSPEFIAFIESTNEFPDEGDYVAINTYAFDLSKIQNDTHFGVDEYTDIDVDQADNDTGNETYNEISVIVSTSNEYLWDINGAFETIGITFDLTLNYQSTSYIEETTTTTEPTTTTTTTTNPELTSGFELLFVFTGLLAIPVVIKKRRS